MKCNIKYIGKSKQGMTKYYCSVHKSFAYDKFGNKLEKCTWSNKEIYDNRLNIKQNIIPKILINDNEFNGVLEYNNYILTYKDFGVIMLSKLNNIPLKIVKCSHCGYYHTDNGKFAYTPHLCLYCGHLFRAKEKNVGSELAMIYDILTQV